MKFRFILIILGILLVFQGLVAAQESTTALPPFASTEDGALLISSDGGEPQEVHNANSFFQLNWNADGTMLAFKQMNEEFEIGLGIYDAATGEVSLLDTPPLNTGLSIGWAADGRILFGAENAENDPTSGPLFQTDILAIEPAVDAQAEVLGTFEYGVGCGGGSSIPADWLYGEETNGLFGNFLTLVETPHGILISLNCGGTGVGLLDPATGEMTIVSEILTRVVVSPDGNQIAGVELNYEDPTAASLLVYNLEDLAVTEIETAAAPDLVIWSADGSNLYYSSRTVSGNLIEDLSTEEQTTLNTAFGYEVTDLPVYTSEIYQVTATGGESTALVSADAYAVGRMTATADGLYYTTISNLSEWLQGVVAGEVDATNFEAPPPFIEAEVFYAADGAEPEAVGAYHQFTPVVTS